MMKCLLIRLFQAIITFGLVANTATAADNAKPNIVIILADDLGYECLGCNGGTSYRTPNLDKLAATGMRFEYCYAQPLCTPSRVQLMTGIYNVRNYVHFGLLAKEQTTFAQLLKKAGYTTCMAGKWQLGAGFDLPGHFGFDEYCLWQLNRRPSRYLHPGFEVNGKSVDYPGKYGPDIESDYACDFLTRAKDKPFVLYFTMCLPHDPWEPTPDSADWDPKKKKSTHGKKYFKDMVAYTDKMVGKVVRKLDELGLRENTLILFSGDNGTAKGITSRLGGREIKGGKGLTTDSGTHVPLIANWPGVVPAGKVSRDLIDFTDFLPTLCDCASVAVPTGLRLDGRSFMPQLRGEKGQPRQWTYCWFSDKAKERPAQEFARNQRYKLYRGGAFYDLNADPLENQPLPGDRLAADAQAARKMLQEVLDKYKDARPEKLRKTPKN